MSSMTPGDTQAAWKAYDEAARGGAPFAATVEAGFAAAYRAGRLAERQEFIEALGADHQRNRASSVGGTTTSSEEQAHG